MVEVPFMSQSVVVPESDVGAIVAVLSACIETCTDGEKGFSLAAADVRDIELKAYLLGKAEERADFVMALQEAVQALGRFPENEGTVKGAVHRGIVAVRKVIEGRSDDLVLQECLRGEIAALHAYDLAIRRTPLDGMPSTVRGLIVHQYTAHERCVADLRHRLATMRRKA